MTELLSIKGLNKSYGGVKASDDVNLSILEGELHAIIGPNGAGKTTLISQLCGNVMPDSGTVHFAGRDITTMDEYKRPHLDEPNLPNHLTHSHNECFGQLATRHSSASWTFLPVLERCAPSKRKRERRSLRASSWSRGPDSVSRG